PPPCAGARSPSSLSPTHRRSVRSDSSRRDRIDLHDETLEAFGKLIPRGLEARLPHDVVAVKEAHRPEARSSVAKCLLEREDVESVPRAHASPQQLDGVGERDELAVDELLVDHDARGLVLEH